MFNKKIIILALLLLALPSMAQAERTYTACSDVSDPGTCNYTVHYEGLVPCGRCLPVDGHGGSAECTQIDLDGLTNVSCQLCHFFILLNNIINFLLLPPTGMVWLIGLILIVIGGVMLLVSGGNPGLRKRAYGIFTSVTIGITICLTAWIITNTFFLAIGVAKWTGLSATGSNRWFQIDCPVEVPQP